MLAPQVHSPYIPLCMRVPVEGSAIFACVRACHIAKRYGTGQHRQKSYVKFSRKYKSGTHDARNTFSLFQAAEKEKY